MEKTREISHAMILAAGLGTRLRPLTELIPKPLVPVCNVPLLDNVISNLAAAGIRHIAINCHYMAQQLEDFIRQHSLAERLTLFHEPEILGTGGPLVNAAPLLRQSSNFVLHNSDILTDMDLKALCRQHLEHNNLVTMALIDGPENRVCVTADGRIHDILDRLGRRPPGSKKLTYSGVMVLSQEIFDWLPSRPENCSIITAILKLMAEKNNAVGAFIPENCYWNDIGTLPKYFQAHRDILKGKVKLNRLRFDAKGVCQAPNSNIAENCQLSGFVVIGEGAAIHANAMVKDAVLLARSNIAAGEYCRDLIATPHGFIHRDYNSLKQLKIMQRQDIAAASISSLPEAGSARRFYRVATAEKSFVLMLSNQHDTDFERFVSYGQFMNGRLFPTPDIYCCCPDEYSVLMEDLGNTTLCRAVREQNGNHKTTAEFYRAAIDALLDFQRHGAEQFRSKTAPPLRDFDYDYLRWESEYFQQQFITRYCGITLTGEEKLALENFFTALAKETEAQPKILIHRDFQSQNILLTPSGPRFVDFQGMRWGPPGYDIISLLNDPYVELTAELRRELLSYYLSHIKKDITGDFERFITTAWLQRGMQILGAFAFLGLVKQKTYYLSYIPRATKLLLEGLARLPQNKSSSVPAILPHLVEGSLTASQSN